ncbi:MAG TPA: SprB repeat-containing protein, partial [Bacteroidia bacterium]|nr:SprB repeat-containing protein [Bacteroidia bacterium]
MNSTFYTRIYLLAALLLGRIAIANAQITNYTFTQSTVNDNFVNGVTLPWVTMSQNAAVIANTSNGTTLVNPLRILYTDSDSIGSAAESATGPGYPIGFNFIYNGESFDRMALSGNGYIKLGHSNQSFTLKNDSIAGDIFDGSVYNQNIISAFQTNTALFDAQLTQYTVASIKTQTMGLPGNRILVIQYEYFLYMPPVGYTILLHYQIALFENNNSIQIAYSTFYNYVNSNNIPGAVGITDGGGNYSNRKVTIGINTWPTSAAGTSVNDLCDFTASFGPQGGTTQNLVYIWTPPTPAPTAPTCPETYISTEYIEFGGAVESTAPDGSYYKDLNNATNVPTNSNTLSWSDVSLTSNQPTTYDVYLDISNPPLIQVAQNLAATSYTPSILAPNTTYYYNIVPINASGRDSACVGSFTTDSTLQYCVVYYGNGRINSFAVNTLSFVATNSNNNEKLPAVSPYITTLKRDTTYNCTITLNSEEANTYPYSNTTNVAVWIDFNQDGNFNDPGDAVGSGSAGLNGTITFPISIPDIAKLGTTTMRLAYKGDNYESLAPCTNSYDLGGDEDFTVTIAPTTSCQNFTISPITANVNCYGQSNGSINLNAAGGTIPYAINWTNGNSTGEITNLTKGIYQATITDANGCEVATPLIPVIQPAALSVDTTTGSNNITTILVSGGTAPYSYLWSNGDTSSNSSNLAAGTYSITVTDA